MLMQHIGVGYFGYYRATAYAMKHSLMPEIAKLRMKALNFWDKHGSVPQLMLLTGTVAKLAMRQPFVLFKGLTFQKLCLPGAFRPGDHHNKMLRPGLCVVHASPQYL